MELKEASGNKQKRNIWYEMFIFTWTCLIQKREKNYQHLHQKMEKDILIL